jgi:hypothetical protein
METYDRTLAVSIFLFPPADMRLQFSNRIPKSGIRIFQST